jgi:hypothetical protein
VIAEDLSQHVLFFRLDDGLLPARPANASSAATESQCVTTTNSGWSLQRLWPQAIWEHPACACTVGTPVSREALELALLFRGESGRETLE